jgi:hypothetical protein
MTPYDVPLQEGIHADDGQCVMTYGTLEHLRGNAWAASLTQGVEFAGHQDLPQDRLYGIEVRSVMTNAVEVGVPVGHGLE